MMLPILISVSVAPESYFFCASAPLLVAANMASAAEAIASFVVVEGIPILSHFLNVVRDLWHGRQWPSRKSPCASWRRGRFLVGSFLGSWLMPKPRQLVA